MKYSKINYSVGALLYCPANNESIVDSLIEEKFGIHFSLALCLEDTISDNHVDEAEEILVNSICKLHSASETGSFYMPKIFIRVRSPHQIYSLLERFGDSREIVTGIIIPKFSLENADEYVSAILDANKTFNSHFYIMPILESPSMVNLTNRYEVLYSLKEKLDRIEDLVISLRVGGNDLCHLFGFRRHSDESIHRISPVAYIFSDIVTVFGMDYVISGPVWEYYSGSNWDKGLCDELLDDKLCGFIGKTVIHPNQIELVHEAYKVTAEDYEDAKAILNWDSTSGSLVSGSVSRERMNEYNTHYHWASKIIILSKVFGIK